MSSTFNQRILEGKVAVVTGGGSGINLAIAERLAEQGASVALIGRTQEKLDNAASGIVKAGGNAAEVVDRVAETVRERFDLKRLIQTLTMQGRMSRWIVSALARQRDSLPMSGITRSSRVQFDQHAKNLVR